MRPSSPVDRLKLAAGQPTIRIYERTVIKGLDNYSAKAFKFLKAPLNCVKNIYF